MFKKLNVLQNIFLICYLINKLTHNFKSVLEIISHTREDSLVITMVIKKSV